MFFAAIDRVSGDVQTLRDFCSLDLQKWWFLYMQFIRVQTIGSRLEVL